MGPSERAALRLSVRAATTRRAAQGPGPRGCGDPISGKVAAFPAVKLLHESRRGTQFARECGRQAATGELIANLDADCLRRF